MNTSDLPTAALIVAALVFLVLNALCTAGVAALGRITRTEAAEAFARGAHGGLRIVKIVAKRPAALAALSVVRFVCISGFAGSTTLALAGFLSQWWYVVLTFAAVVVMALVIDALIAPGTSGVRRPVTVLGWASRPLLAMTNVMGVVVREKEQTPEESEQLQEDQLALMVERVSESEALDDDERELLQSVFDLGHTLTREVMVPRMDMISIRFDQSFDKAISLFSRSGFSRLPVTGESVDDLRGVVYLKDVIRRMHHRNDASDLTVADIMREPLFVPETKVVDELMREMQADQIHIAMVVDEYGGIAGLVTIEDLVEEIVGEISDEHDRAEPEVEDLGGGRYRVPARLPIDELGELFGIELDDDDVDTAGGLFAKELGRVPIAGSYAEFSGIRLDAERFEGRRRRLTTIVASQSVGVDKEDERDE